MTTTNKINSILKISTINFTNNTIKLFFQILQIKRKLRKFESKKNLQLESLANF